MRSRAWATAVTSTALLVGVLAGCDSDASGGGTADPSSPSSGAATDDPTATEGSTPSGPDAASGPRVESQTVVYHLPEGIDWNLDGGGTFAWWSPEGSAAMWSVLQFEHNEREAKELDAIARTNLAGARRENPTTERVENRVVNGVEGWVLEYHGKNSFGSPEFHYEFGAVTGTYWTTFNFDFPQDNPRTRAVIDSLLASIEWKLEE